VTGVRLLRVGDADGNRIHTGTVVDVDPTAYESLRPTENPDDRIDGIGVVLTAGGALLVLGVIVADVAPRLGIEESYLLTVGVALAALGALRLRR